MYLFVINKNSGNGSGGRIWTIIRSILHERNINYEHIVTSSREQAHTMLKERLVAAIRWRAVGVVGGDGTIHGLLPLLRGSGIPLAVIPAGSGNDTARGFNIPIKPLEALRVMLEGQTIEVDLITVQNQVAITALAIGFDAKVADNVNHSWYKKLCNTLGIGRVSYLIGIIHTLLTYRPGSLTIECDGMTEHYSSAWLTAINNVPSYGGGLKICPEANPSDGQLDICIVHNCSRLKLLFLFPTILFGRHVSLPYVKLHRGRSVTIYSSQPIIALGDGEPMGMAPITAAVDPGSLQIMSSSQAYAYPRASGEK
ncbi:diacylglycerol/lipid kinase family protein [Paenibacillus bouchesdurhonensis]|uniref:diacylglycerol/lipid kinase family protein n=1 Tax=Paenibacillus bouchesdurhonensis TaxID=1870990 RepID=UPI000DA63F8D|nr:diacylglycerol kinase family protein [Paenibacillus bouchesdurhonensis]